MFNRPKCLILLKFYRNQEVNQAVFHTAALYYQDTPQVHWRYQIWGSGAHAPSPYSYTNLAISVYIISPVGSIVVDCVLASTMQFTALFTQFGFPLYYKLFMQKCLRFLSDFRSWIKILAMPTGQVTRNRTTPSCKSGITDIMMARIPSLYL